MTFTDGSTGGASMATGGYVPRRYDEIVRDLLTTLTGGVATETHPVPATGLDELWFDRGPVARVSHIEGAIDLGDGPVAYRFTERDYELVETTNSTPASPSFDRVRFGSGQVPAPFSAIIINYYPLRRPPTPINDINVGSVARTLLETIGRELATQNAQLKLVYESAAVDTAIGIGLDRVAALVDTKRLKRRHPVGQLRMIRRPGSTGSVTIPVGLAVTDGAGNRYLTTDGATMLPGQSTIEVWVHGETSATEPVDAGTLTVIERTVAGVDRVINDTATFRATEDETDDQLRRRAKAAIHTAGRGTLDSLRSGLAALDFVSAVNLVEYPDGIPGTIRVDVSLSEDNPFNRQLIDRRIAELRPAGIMVTSAYSDPIPLTIDAALTLGGAAAPTSEVDAILAGVADRLAEQVNSLGPGATLRRTRLVSAVLTDERIVDVALTITVAGATVPGDTYDIPPQSSVRVDPSLDVTFAPPSFEGGPGDTPLTIPVDIHLTVTLLDDETTIPSAEARIRQLVAPTVATATSLDPSVVQGALVAETGFAALAAETVVAVEQLPGSFTEIRPGEPPFNRPSGQTFELRDVLGLSADPAEGQP